MINREGWNRLIDSTWMMETKLRRGDVISAWEILRELRRQLGEWRDREKEKKDEESV